MARALRRHHRRRVMANRKDYHTLDGQPPGRMAKTPCPCSCELCRNPERTIQELRVEQAYVDQFVSDIDGD